MNKIDKIKYPIFCPDATRGAVRNLDQKDLDNIGTKSLVVNTLHLLRDLGIDYLRNAGGIKKFMNFNGLVISDSGGFQVMSMLHTGKIKGEINDNGAIFQLTKKDGSKDIINLTPEKSIDIQFAIGSDLKIVLDEFTDPKRDKIYAKKSVEQTTRWSQRSKIQFDKNKSIETENKDNKNAKLLAVIQGGKYKDLRELSYKQLSKIDYDGYGLGGFPMKEDGAIDYDLCKFIADLVPKDKIKFALGIGKPQDIIELSKMGWQIFDCVLPTRDARHGRLYTINKNISDIKDIYEEKDLISTIDIGKGKYKEDFSPVGETLEDYPLKNVTKAYLHYLYKIKEGNYYRLATLHNLYLYNTVCNLIKLRSI